MRTNKKIRDKNYQFFKTLIIEDYLYSYSHVNYVEALIDTNTINTHPLKTI